MAPVLAEAGPAGEQREAQRLQTRHPPLRARALWRGKRHGLGRASPSPRARPVDRDGRGRVCGGKGVTKGQD